MSLYSEWLELSEPTFKKIGLSSEGCNSLGLKRSPIYFKEDMSSHKVPQFKDHFFNIIPYKENLFSDEFSSDENNAVLVRGESYKKEISSNNIFFQQACLIDDGRRQALSQDEKNIDLGIDPYSLSLWRGELCSSKSPFEYIDSNRENLKVFRLSSLAYDMSGATPVQQLAILLSSTFQLVKNYEGVLSVDKILSYISYEVSLNNHCFLNIAKLQSLRILLTRFYEVLESDEGAPSIYGMPSPRYLATREPWNNMLRISTMGFSAMSGGAQGFFSLPFDLFSKNEGGRFSRNSLLVLEQESFLKKVNNASEGSGLVKDLVDQLCVKSWEFFQEIEKKGGILSVLQSGWLQNEIDCESKKEKEDFVRRKNVMIGVNEFALTNSLSDEFPLVTEGERLGIADWWIGYTNDKGVKKRSDVQRLKPHQMSHSFEKWQFLADKYHESKGKKLKVSVFCEDSKAQKDKLSLVYKLMGIAGIEVEECDKESLGVQPVSLFIAADPEGAPVINAVQSFQKKGCQFSLWVGIREQSHFDDYIGSESNLMESYEKIFKHYGVQL